MSDFPLRLRCMADFSLEAQTVTKIIPQGATFLREAAEHIKALERIVYLYADPMAMPDGDAEFVSKVCAGLEP